MALKLNGTNSVAAPAYAGADADTGLQCGTDEVNLVTGGTARLHIDSSGNVGVGTASPTTLLEIKSDGTAANEARLSVNEAYNSGSSEFGIDFKRTYDSGGANQDAGYIRMLRDGGNSNAGLAFATGNRGSVSERMRIDSSGVVNVNTTTSSIGTRFNIHNGSDAANIFGITGADETSEYIALGIETGVPTITAGGIGSTNSSLKFRTASSGTEAERMRIDSSGNVGIGTSSPTSYGNSQATLVIEDDTNPAICWSDTGQTRDWWAVANGSNLSFVYADGGGSGSASNVTAALSMANSGNVGIGTSSPSSKLHALNPSGGSGTTEVSTIERDNSGYFFKLYRNAGSGNVGGLIGADSVGTYFTGGHNVNNRLYIDSVNEKMHFFTNSAERMRIDSSGRVGIGTSSPNHKLTLATTSTDTFDAFNISSGNTSSTGYQIGVDSSGNVFHWNTTNSDIKFATNNTERMRIRNDGNIYFHKTGTNIGTLGFQFLKDGPLEITSNNNRGLLINRLNGDGQLVAFDRAGTTEGSITVSGSTVSYNGGHLSRWSQLAAGAARIEILRGSVLSNLDEMCEWGEEDNEQLNRMQVSDVEGDRNVAGVFQDWDDDDDTYTNDFYCAMTGDFVIRIAQGTTVARGDLLMSAGDGTAKPQDDDIVRSKTIAKVTSTTVSTTYSDGSYCVPCVLMAC